MSTYQSFKGQTQKMRIEMPDMVPAIVGMLKGFKGQTQKMRIEIPVVITLTEPASEFQRSNSENEMI